MKELTTTQVLSEVIPEEESVNISCDSCGKVCSKDYLTLTNNWSRCNAPWTYIMCNLCHVKLEDIFPFKQY
jgi:D-arabinose 1-dehydrogenase-like Zn-dependent alcohol dehydrogenase